MKDTLEKGKRYRYPGGKPFSENENELFFGREQDCVELSNLIFLKPIVVLFGKSGYGKSSIINAGIFPLLKSQDHYAVFSIRFNNHSIKEPGEPAVPVDIINAKLGESVSKAEYRDLCDIISDQNSLWFWIKLLQLKNTKIQKTKIIIFFDQFEELFTYSKEDVQKFSEQLSQLLYSTMPLEIRRELEDLFERGFITDELYEFLHSKPDLKVVFSIRADRLSQLNILSERLPTILQNCYELNALSVEDASLAITKPARLFHDSFKTPTFKIDAIAIDKILHTIANDYDGKIEAATLQIICRHIEENYVFEKGIRYITEEHLGDITDIFKQYYEGVLNKLTPADRLKAQRLIEDELIDVDRRNALTGSYIKNRFDISEKLLDALEQSSLLKKERDSKARYSYEISHDSIVTAINQVAEKRRIKEDLDRTLKLENDLVEEKHNTLKYSRLHSKAARRYRAMLVLFIITLFAIITCIFYAAKSHRDFDLYRVSQEKEKKALSEKLKEEELSKASSIINDADNYKTLHIMGYRDTACIRYQLAFKIVSKYPNEPLYRELMTKIRTTCAKD